MNLSIKELRSALHQAAQEFKAASGMDTIISRADFDALLERQRFDFSREMLKALHQFALGFEQEGGRVTHTDIDRIVKILEDEIFPAFHLTGGIQLAEKTQRILYGIGGEEYVELAQVWKRYAEEIHAVPSEDVVDEIRPLLQGLKYNKFSPVDSAIDIYKIEDAGVLLLTTERFWESLKYSDHNQGEEIERLKAGFQEADAGEDWMTFFPTIQETDEKKQNARTIIERLRGFFVQFLEVTYSYSSEERSIYQLLALDEAGDITVFEHRFFWT